MLVRVRGLGHRAAEPLGHMLRPVVDVHPPVVEPPKVLALEEVRLACVHKRVSRPSMAAICATKTNRMRRLRCLSIKERALFLLCN